MVNPLTLVIAKAEPVAIHLAQESEPHLLSNTLAFRKPLIDKSFHVHDHAKHEINLLRYPVIKFFRIEYLLGATGN